MRHAKKDIFKTVVVLASLWLLMGFVAADIPSYVDFHAEQTTAYDPATDNNPWVIKKDLHNYYPDYNPLDPTVPGTGPQWTATTDDAGDDYYNKLHVNNQSHPVWYKELWLEIHIDPWSPSMGEWELVEDVPFDIEILTEAGTTATLVEPASVVLVDLDGDNEADETRITWKWILDPQPGWEQLVFTKKDSDGDPVDVGRLYWDGTKTQDITSIEVGTYCIPVPGSLLLCGVGLGFIGIVRRFKRR